MSSNNSEFRTYDARLASYLVINDEKIKRMEINGQNIVFFVFEAVSERLIDDWLEGTAFGDCRAAISTFQHLARDAGKFRQRYLRRQANTYTKEQENR